MPREEVIRKGRLDAVNRNVVVATHAIQLDIVGIAALYTRQHGPFSTRLAVGLRGGTAL
jgi:hypothetical protein